MDRAERTIILFARDHPSLLYSKRHSDVQSTISSQFVFLRNVGGTPADNNLQGFR